MKLYLTAQANYLSVSKKSEEKKNQFLAYTNDLGSTNDKKILAKNKKEEDALSKIQQEQRASQEEYRRLTESFNQTQNSFYLAFKDTSNNFN